MQILLGPLERSKMPYLDQQKGALVELGVGSSEEEEGGHHSQALAIQQ